MNKFALFVFNGDPMCFIHVLLNALDMKSFSMLGKVLKMQGNLDENQEVTFLG
jgi:hypothetical protein